MDNFLDLEDNDKLSEMKYDDIIEFLCLLKEYNLSLRERINLNETNTFGLEIEFENLNIPYEELCSRFENMVLFPSLFLNGTNLQKLKEYRKQNKRGMEFIESIDDKYLKISPDEVFYWSVGIDNSLNNGAEITSPILVDKSYHWKDLKKVCDFIKQYGEISEHSAGHIHLGTQILGKEKASWFNFIKLWSVYENVIYRFAYNEYLNKNPGIRYCKPMSDMLSKYYKTFMKYYDLDTILYFLKDDRTYSINFKNVLLSDKVIPFGTLEIRNPNGTLDPVIWQNNVNFFSKFLLCSKSDKFDMDIVLTRERNLFDFKKYNQVFTEQAIELADLLFDNNLDKIYFLRQYIKDGETSLVPMKKTKKFTI